MKQHLLLGAALLSAVSAFPQNAKTKTNTSGMGKVNSAAKINQRIANENSPLMSNATSANAPASAEPDNTNVRTSSTSSFVTTWNPFTGSMNVYGVVEGACKPLQYNEDLNSVTFIHRKSQTYTVTPVPTTTTAASGVLVGMVSQNFGNTWDSTCVWNDNNRWARYPQGGVYNVAGNTNINNAYIIGVAPITQANTALGWIGTGFASKQMGAANYNNVASTVANAAQFIPNSAPYAANIGKLDFAAYEFTSPDDGKVRALGYVNNDPNGTTTAAFGYVGANLVTGAFNSSTSTFDWTGDSIIPTVAINTDGSLNLIARPHMAWSESGQIGYVVHIGCRPNTTGANRGYQPIIHKTTNYGASWAEVPTHINFNDPTFVAPVLDHILSTKSNTNATIPFFNYEEGIGMTVDKDDKLHIAAVLRGTYSDDPDSLGYTFTIPNSDGETYAYAHSPGLRPYLYDFIGDGQSAWKVVTVDSLPSENPGSKTTDDGYANGNLWDATGGTTNDRVPCEARIQLSRTADGKYIVYTWAESDSTATGYKWNKLPNVKARLMDVATSTIYSNEINITRPAQSSLRNTKVDSRAFFHYVAPKCAVAQTIAVGANGPAIVLPMTITNNTGLNQLLPVTHRYASTALNFGNIADGDVVLPSDPRSSNVGVKENALSSTQNSFIYPNPAKNAAVLAIDLKDNSGVNISVLNMVGQVVKTSSNKGQIGQNAMNIDLSGLSKGIYMVNIKVDNASSTKKLIVE